MSVCFGPSERKKVRKEERKNERGSEKEKEEEKWIKSLAESSANYTAAYTHYIYADKYGSVNDFSNKSVWESLVTSQAA